MKILFFSVQEGSGEGRGRRHVGEFCQAALGTGAGEIWLCMCVCVCLWLMKRNTVESFTWITPCLCADEEGRPIQSRWPREDWWRCQSKFPISQNDHWWPQIQEPVSLKCAGFAHYSYSCCIVRISTGLYKPWTFLDLHWDSNCWKWQKLVWTNYQVNKILTKKNQASSMSNFGQMSCRKQKHSNYKNSQNDTVKVTNTSIPKLVKKWNHLEVWRMTLCVVGVTQALYDAGLKRKGTDVATWISIMTERSIPHLQKGTNKNKPDVTLDILSFIRFCCMYVKMTFWWWWHFCGPP